MLLQPRLDYRLLRLNHMLIHQSRLGHRLFRPDYRLLQLNHMLLRLFRLGHQMKFGTDVSLLQLDQMLNWPVPDPGQMRQSRVWQCMKK